MNIISICALAIVSCVLSLAIKRHNSELSVLVSIGAAVIVLMCVIQYTLDSMDFITSLLAKADVSSENVVILFKVVGICFLTEFTCDTVKESGLHALSGNIALAGKIVVLITALPMFTEILTLVTNLVAGE